MAINIKFDLVGNPEPPTIILANRNGKKFGQLEVETDSVELKDSINDASEISFTLNKYIDGRLTNLWDKVVDFKLVYCKEWDMWFEIKVELDEATKTIKTVFGTQLGKAELSQIMLYNIEINTEKDIERDDYKISILYDANDPEASILNRVLEKAPHYSIAYVDPDIATMQRSFSFNDTSICDAFQEIAESIDCVFVYHSGSNENGMPQRAISVYSSSQYGEDTLIFVTSDELATEGIRLTTDTDAVKNCYKLEAGDELMTATIRNCNPSGTDYVWCFSNRFMEDMSGELVSKLGSYSGLHEHYANNYVSDIDASLLNKYNSLTNKYSAYNDDLQAIPLPIKGYATLMNTYYNTVDFALYLKSGLMPSVTMSETNAKEQASLLTASSLSPVAVADIKTVSLATANSAALAMAKVIVRSTFKVRVNDSGLSEDKKTWTGNFVVTNYSDEEDTAISEVVSIEVNDDLESFIEQKIDRALNKENTDDLSISGLFEKEYDDFCAELQKYSLNPLVSFRDACQACIDILIEQGVGNDGSWSDDTDGSESNLYEKLYVPYYNKLTAIEAEIQVREDEISIIDELQKGIASNKNQIHEDLDFEKYLGENLWLEFSSYRREGKYSNENYVSDGLNNTELFNKAAEFIAAAEGEIDKSSELQHSISTTLNNLLAIPKFKPIVKSFATGNWIRVQVDDEIYRLRLISYEVNYGDFNNISVEFSDVIKISGGVASVRTILSKASSMASTYEEIKKQSEQGDKANGTIEQWLADGLNSAFVRISNNDNEEITITKNGLLGRSYDDVADDYSPEQFKLTHNIMAYTTDNWKTVSTALGKHGYVYWDGAKFVNGEDYGLTTKFVNAGYINGSQFIGGRIASSNYKPNKSGTYINLIDGDFDFAGGKIVYDTNNNALTLKDVTIAWDSNTNAPTVTDITGLSEYLDRLENVEDQLNGQVHTYSQTNDPSGSWAEDEYDDHIGDLWVNPDDGVMKRWNGSSWEIVADSELTQELQQYVDSEISKLDNAISTYLGWDGTTIIDDKHVISPYISGGYLNITGNENKLRVIIDPNNLTNNGYVFQIHNGNTEKIIMGVDSSGNAEFTGTIHATDGEFTGDISASTIKGSTVESSEIIGGSLRIGDDESGYYAWITEGGVLNASGVNISGEIHSTKGGSIANFYIDDYGIYNGTLGEDNSIFLSTADMSGVSGFFEDDVDDNGDDIDNWRMTVGSKFGVTSDGSVHATSGIFEDCTITGGSLRMGNEEDGYSAWISVESGVLNANGANITGEIYATSGSFSDGIFDNCTIEDTCTIKGKLVGATGTFSGAVSASTISGGSLYISSEDGTTYAEISNDGVLNANGVNISGEINATSGSFEDGVFNNCTIENTCTIKGNLVGATGDFSGTINATGGTIGGWEINTGGLISSESNVGLRSDNKYTYTSLTGLYDEQSVRFFAGLSTDEGSMNKSVVVEGVQPSSIDSVNQIAYYTITVDDLPDTWDEFPYVYKVESVEIEQEWASEMIEDIIIEENVDSIVVSVSSTSTTYETNTIRVVIKYNWGEFNTTILEDGSLYAKAADISGRITAGDASCYIVLSDGEATSRALDYANILSNDGTTVSSSIMSYSETNLKAGSINLERFLEGPDGNDGTATSHYARIGWAYEFELKEPNICPFLITSPNMIIGSMYKEAIDGCSYDTTGEFRGNWTFHNNLTVGGKELVAWMRNVESRLNALENN